MPGTSYETNENVFKNKRKKENIKILSKLASEVTMMKSDNKNCRYSRIHRARDIKRKQKNDGKRKENNKQTKDRYLEATVRREKNVITKNDSLLLFLFC